ncbi:MAG: polyhydroxybutyrate depolymerase, partial [Pseudomonadota bacterium]
DTPATARLGALVYMHGWQGTARGVIRFAALRKVATRYGLALIAPTGRGKTWSYPGSPSKRRDEFAFFDALLDDAVARFNLDPHRLIASGFSMGGSMAWYLACRRSARFAGFVPVAGAFWRPHPESCDGPPPLIVHTHGLSDGTVPMNGRPIGDGYHQGSVRESIELMRRESRCTGAAEPQTMFDGTRSQLVCTRYTGCASGLVTLCLHNGSHSIRAEWVEHGVGKVFAAQGWATPGR